MNRSRQAAIVVALSENLQSNGSWCGETHVQKSTYFLQKMAKVPLSFEFRNVQAWAILVRPS